MKTHKKSASLKKATHYFSLNRKMTDKTAKKSDVETLFASVPKLLESRKFRSVNPNDKNNKVFGKYLISGATVKWETKKEDFVYSYELRLAGSEKQVKDFINTLSQKQILELKKIHPEKNEHISSKKDILNRIINRESFKSTKKLKNSPKKLFEFEKEMHNILKVKLQKAKKNIPDINMYYEAFLIHKQKLKDIESGLVKTGGSGKNKPVRMEGIGTIYKELKSGEILNIYGYGDANGKASIIKVQDKYLEGKKKMYKVPGYKMVTSRKKDVEVILKDLMNVGAIELKKGKQFESVIVGWETAKRTGDLGIEELSNTNGVEDGPEEVNLNGSAAGKKKRPPQITKAKVTVNKH